MSVAIATTWRQSSAAHARADAESRKGHDDVIQWKHFPRYWPFVRGIHRSQVNSPHKGQWRWALMFFFYLRMNKRLSKQSRRRWFATPSRPLWHHCNDHDSIPINGCWATCRIDFFKRQQSLNNYNYILQMMWALVENMQNSTPRLFGCGQTPPLMLVWTRIDHKRNVNDSWTNSTDDWRNASL